MSALVIQLTLPGMEPYEPTPDEIAEQTAKIRAGWTPKEEVRRRHIDDRPESWTPPVFPDHEFTIKFKAQKEEQ